jgi:hypothetical protein
MPGHQQEGTGRKRGVEGLRRREVPGVEHPREQAGEQTGVPKTSFRSGPDEGEVQTVHHVLEFRISASLASVSTAVTGLLGSSPPAVRSS